MELPTLQWLAIPTLLVLAGLVIGFSVGSRRCYRTVRRLERDLNRQHLQTLDLNAELLAIERQDERCGKLERLIRLTLGRLKRAETQTLEQGRVLGLQQKRHRVEVASMTVQLAQSRERCRAAIALAGRATAQLKRLENIDTQQEQNLIAAGSHRGQQPGTLAEDEITELPESVGMANGHDHSSANGHDHSSDWVGSARELMQEQVPAP